MRKVRAGRRSTLLIALGLLVSTGLGTSLSRADEPRLDCAHDTWETSHIDINSGSNFTAYRIRFDHDDFFETEAYAESIDGASLGVGLWILDSAGAPLQSFVWSSHSGSVVQAHTGLGNFHHTSSLPTGTDQWLSIGLGGNFLDPGEYTVISMGTGKGKVTSGAAVCGGFILDSVVSGPAFMNDETDFAGDVNLSIVAPYQLSAGLMNRTSTEEAISHRLFAAFEAGAISSAGYDGPDGGMVGQSFYVFDGTPAGQYRFWVQAQAGAPYSSVLAWGADIPI